MGADNADIHAGDVVAVWGAGGVGEMAARAALLMGAERVIVIDRLAERLRMVEDVIGAETLDSTDVDVHDALLEATARRGPDRCIEAVGMEAHHTGLEHAYDRVKQALHLHTERGASLRQAIRACRKGGVVSVLGVFGGFLDKTRMSASMMRWRSAGHSSPGPSSEVTPGLMSRSTTRTGGSAVTSWVASSSRTWPTTQDAAEHRCNGAKLTDPAVSPSAAGSQAPRCTSVCSAMPRRAAGRS
jgi:threonine dehydrogenase-like Zn-dependent dehydrogenase